MIGFDWPMTIDRHLSDLSFYVVVINFMYIGRDGEMTCTLYWMCYMLEEARVCIWGVGRPALPCCILQ